MSFSLKENFSSRAASTDNQTEEGHVVNLKNPIATLQQETRRQTTGC
jgi:hypothetical protein